MSVALQSLFTKPWIMMLISVALSFSAWSIPNMPGLRHGFENHADLTLTSAATLMVWYLTLTMMCIIGYGMGRLVIPRLRPHRSIQLSNILPYWTLTGLAIVGNLVALKIIFAQFGVSEFIDLVMIGQGNRIRHSLYNDYSIGVVSLRYLVCASSAIALLRVFRMGLRGWLDFLNFGLLILTTFIAGRLSIICTVIIFGFAYSSYDTRRHRFNWSVASNMWHSVFHAECNEL